MEAEGHISCRLGGVAKGTKKAPRKCDTFLVVIPYSSSSSMSSLSETSSGSPAL